MEHKDQTIEVIDIPLAERRYLKENKIKFNKKFLILTFLVTLFTAIGFSLWSRLNINSLKFNNTVNVNNEATILGHLPYEEIAREELVFIEPHIWVHNEMSESLLKMRKDAKNEGIYLVFLSGFRSIKLQEDIFYSLKSIRNQTASERARVSAPPGYSEHSTGYAIDIGDANFRQTDFEVEFENTDVFKWLKKNAAKYHFKLSFDKNNKNVDYEPWHWRYEGSIKALKVFEASNRKLINENN